MNQRLKKALNLLAILFSFATGMKYAAAFEDGDILFYASFDNTVAPDIARGGKEYVLGQKDEIKYCDGVKGQAAILGKTGMLRYLTQGNVNISAGAISMWVKPVDLDFENEDSKIAHIFFDSRLGKNRLLLYKYDGKQIIFLLTAGDYADSTRAGFKEWETDEWRHVVCSWNSKSIKIYLDGNLKNDAGIEKFPEKLGDNFYVGCSERGFGTSKTPNLGIDEFYIFKRELSPAEAKKLYEMDIPGKEKKDEVSLSPPRLVIQKTDAPPVIDGKMEEGEWKYASCVTGFIDIFKKPGPAITEAQTHVYATYDDRKLYFAFKTEIPRGGQLTLNETARDSRVWYDDAIELYLDPGCKKEPGKFIQFLGNALGGIADFKNGDFKWNGKWDYKNSITNNRWTAELAIDFDELGAKSPADGEMWGMNFCRDIKTGHNVGSAWAFTPKYFANIEYFGQIVFKDKAPVMEMDSLGDLWRGDMKLNGTIKNFGKEPRDVLLAVAVLNGKDPAKDIFEIERDIKLDPGQAGKYEVEKKLRGTGSDLIKITVKDKNSGEIYYKADLPFSIGKEDMLLSIQIYPTKGIMDVAVDLRAMAKEVLGKADKIKIALKEKESDKTIKEKEIKYPADNAPDFSEAQFNIEDLKVGKYLIEADLSDKAGGQLGRQVEEISKVATNDWRGNKIGIDNKVPKPWTPMDVSDGAIKCWGREYKFKDSILFGGLTSRQEEMLQSGLRLTASINGHDLTPCSIENRVDKKADDEVIITSSGAFTDRLKIRNRIKMEFDGFSRIDMEIAPEGEVGLDKLVLEIPIKKETAKFLHYGQNYTKIEKNWNSNFVPTVWLGNEYRGICWYAETAEKWINKEADKQIELINEKTENALLRINFIDTPTSIKTPVLYTFGIIATPVKPLPKDWPLHYVNSFKAEIYKYNYIFPPYRNSDPLEFQNPAPGYDKKVKHLHDRGELAIVWEQLNTVTPLKEYKYYFDEWKNNQSSALWQGGDDRTLVGVCPKSGWSDALLYGMSERVAKYDLDGVYFDTGGLVGCNNLEHGCGYKDSSGALRKTYPIFSHHEFKKRLYKMLAEKKGEKAYLSTLVNGNINIPVLTFDTAIIDGEEFNGGVAGDYNEVLNFDLLKTEFNNNVWGVINVLLPVRAIKPELMKSESLTDTLLTYTLLSGTPLWVGYCNLERVNQVYLSLTKAFNFENSEFTPFWESDKYVELSNGGTKASLFVDLAKQASVIIVSNFTKEEIKEKIRIKPTLFDKNSVTKLTASDIMSGTSLEVKNNEINLNIKKRSFVLIKVCPSKV